MSHSTLPLNSSSSGAQWRPLQIAARTNDVHQLLAILAENHDTIDEQVSEFEWTALHVAAAYNHPTIVSALLHFGADPDIYDTDGDTALIAAASLGYTEVVQQLLNKANVMQASLNGETALHVAADAGYDDIVSLLIPRGGVKLVETRTRSGHTARDMALANGCTEIIALIDEYCESCAEQRRSVRSRLQTAAMAHQ